MGEKQTLELKVPMKKQKDVLKVYNLIQKMPGDLELDFADVETQKVVIKGNHIKQDELLRKLAKKFDEHVKVWPTQSNPAAPSQEDAAKQPQNPSDEKQAENPSSSSNGAKQAENPSSSSNGAKQTAANPSSSAPYNYQQIYFYVPATPAAAPYYISYYNYNPYSVPYYSHCCHCSVSSLNRKDQSNNTG